MDKNDYYGGESTSLNLTQARKQNGDKVMHIFCYSLEIYAL